MIIKATKKPVTIECVKWDGENIEEIKAFFCHDHIYRAQTLKHKKRYQQKQINKRLVSNGLRPKYKV